MITLVDLAERKQRPRLLLVLCGLVNLLFEREHFVCGRQLIRTALHLAVLQLEGDGDALLLCIFIRIIQAFHAERRQLPRCRDVFRLTEQCRFTDVTHRRCRCNAALIRQPFIIAEHVGLHGQQTRTQHCKDDNQLQRLAEDGAEVERVNDLHHAVENDRAEHQTDPEPQLGFVDQHFENLSERRTHNHADNNLDGQLDRVECQCRARPLAFSDAEQEQRQCGDNDRRNRIADQQTDSTRLLQPGGVIHRIDRLHCPCPAMHFRAVYAEILNQRCKLVAEQQRSHGSIRHIGLEEHALETLPQCGYECRSEVHPQTEQQRDDRVAAQDGRNSRHRVQQEEENDVGRDHADERCVDHLTEAHRTCTDNAQRMQHEVRHQRTQRTGRVVHREQAAARNRQAVIEIHLAAIVQVREHAHAAGDRQNDDGQLDKHILSAEHLTDALHISLPACRSICRTQIDQILLMCRQAVLRRHNHRQQLCHKESHRGQHDGPQIAFHAIPHETLRTGVS